ncbi:MAG: hypothetical protein JJV94_04445 [Sulfurospirillum sp.]|nr:hypothetical protein [Sulfurospirillum sp.]
MEDKNELSDIVLEKDNSKSMNAKRVLVVIALLIVVFLVVLVAMRVLNKPSEQNSVTKLILPPSQIEEVITQDEDDLFKQVPIIEEVDEKESFEEMVKSLKAKEIQKQENLQPKSKAQKTTQAKTQVKTKTETKASTATSLNYFNVLV